MARLPFAELSAHYRSGRALAEGAPLAKSDPAHESSGPSLSGSRVGWVCSVERSSGSGGADSTAELPAGVATEAVARAPAAALAAGIAI